MTSDAHLSPVALSDQLAWAARLMEAVGKGRSLTEALNPVPADIRPGAQALAFDGLRRWGTTSAIVRRLTQRPPEERTRALLCVAIGLLIVDEAAADRPRYAEHTVVDQAVSALTRWRQPAAVAGFVNACLRRFLRERSALLDSLDSDDVAVWNHPAWWIDQVRNDHPDHWQAILRSNQQHPPMALRVNRMQQSRDAYLERLADTGVAAVAVGDDAVVLDRAVPVEQLPGWDDGAVSVQDVAAQWAAALLLDGAERPRRVLDACAAPGGKTAHLLERGVEQVLALDKDARRCERVRENLARLHLQAQVQVADAGEPEAWWDGRPFDAILLDAPCTASGIVRRHPDVRWLRRPGDVEQLARQQRRLLDALWPLLRPGGRLLYCTCSVFRAEGADQIADFLLRHRDACPLPSPGHVLPGDNRPSGTDGFFYALLQKQG